MWDVLADLTVSDEIGTEDVGGAFAGADVAADLLNPPTPLAEGWGEEDLGLGRRGGCEKPADERGKLAPLFGSEGGPRL